MSKESNNDLYKNLVLQLIHEVRNPLSTLNVNLQVMKTYWQDAVTTKEKLANRKIDVLISVLNALDKTLDKFYRFVCGFDLKPIKYNVNRSIKELIDFLEFEMEERNIKLDCQLDQNLPDIYVDPELIKQAIYNVILNAIQSMPRGGVLTLKTEKLPDKDYIELTIQDTGCGIKKEDLDKIFHLGFSTKTTGLGLGLSIVKRIVDAHCGKISVASEYQKGTTFKILLPTTLLDKEKFESSGELLKN